MTDEQLIKKAKKVLDAIGILHKNKIISVIREHDELILKMDESLKDKYIVMFSYRPKGRRISLVSVEVYKHTNKLLLVVTPSNMYDVPEELQ